jgi:hypothetical protein
MRESHFNAGKLATPPTAAVANLPTPADNVRAWRVNWAGLYSALQGAPAVAATLEPGDCRRLHRGPAARPVKPATARQHLATIVCAHRAANLLNPNDDEDVKLGLYNKSAARQRPLGWYEVKRFLITAGVDTHPDRDVRYFDGVGHDGARGASSSRSTLRISGSCRTVVAG